MPDTDARLSKIEAKLDAIAATVATIAVQKEKISHIEQQVTAVWKKYDTFCAPGGVLDKLQHHQSSCPRGQMKFLWLTMIPVGLALLASAYALIQVAVHP